MTSRDQVLEEALARCAEEPIHIPGTIQPHGALLVLSADGTSVLQASSNAAAVLGTAVAPGPLLANGRHGLTALSVLVTEWLAGGEPLLSRALQLQDRDLHVTGHAGAQGLLVEVEARPPGLVAALDTLFPRVRRLISEVENEPEIRVVCQTSAREVRIITGFDRVLVYRFDEDEHGSVIAEDGNGALPSYLDLRFPASDIPPQARELYRINRVRLIPDANYEPVPVLPAASPVDGAPLDLSAVALRSVSPVHLEYMRNMGTLASMSISIVVDGRLWGLISCHNATPRLVSPPQLSACDFLGQMLALQIGARERSVDAAERLKAKDIEVELLARMSRADSLHGGLAERPREWMRLLDATGAAVVMDHTVVTAGRAPTVPQVQALADWLRAQQASQPDAPVFATDALAAQYEPAHEFADVACGVLAVPVSAIHAHYVMWFRPELVRTVRWGGEPEKTLGADGRLRPRRSFQTWTEIVSGRAARWTRRELDAARSFRNGVVNFVLRRAEERAALTEQLEASNKELESFSYSISHDLRAPFRHIVGFARLLSEQEPQLQTSSRHYLNTIIDAALNAGHLVDDLLSFSQLGRTSVELRPVDMNKVVAELRKSLESDQIGRQVQWQVGTLPPALGDPTLLRQTLANLLENALKYTRNRDTAVIAVEGEQRDHETVYTVRDNGVGFDMTYVGKLFGVFQRLHRVEEFEGSGIGLALARRIIDRHGGWITAEGKLGEGATFRFGLPSRPPMPRESEPT